MSNWNQGKSITSTIHSIIWVGGLAIIFMRGRFFPDILILVAVSMAADLIIKLVLGRSGTTMESADLPETLEPLAPMEMAAEQDPSSELNDRMQRIDPEPDPIPPASRNGNPDRLPDACPACGAPLTARDVEWLSENKVKCGFCGTHITVSA